MLDKLRRVSVVLGSVPSLVYAMAYLGAIPSFAALYYFALPNEFYHSTVQFERGPMELMLNRIGGEIRSSILSQRQRKCGTYTLTTLTIQNLVVSPNPSDIGQVKDFGHWAVKGPEVSFLLFSEYKEDSKQAFAWNYEPLLISLPPFDFDKPGGQFVMDYFEVKSQTGETSASRGSDKHQPDPDVIDCLFPKRGKVPNVLGLKDQLVDDVITYAEAKRGFPRDIDGQFVRMLYLSATTITTLGFGDIVPLSSSARLAIAVEAVVGIVIMGLFLNAIAQQR
jgi:hypothetical protein